MATDSDVAVLRAYEGAWIDVLHRLLDDVDLALEKVRREIKGPERALVVADFEDEVLTELVGPEEAIDENTVSDNGHAGVTVPSVPQLQLSWMPGRLVAWSAGPGTRPESSEAVLERLGRLGAASNGWEEHRSVKLPDGSRADAVAAPLQQFLGWLVGLSSPLDDETAGPSVTWLGLVAARAVRLAAQGRMVPQLKEARRSGKEPQTKNGPLPFEVRWVPALIEDAELTELVQSLPGAVTAFENRRDARAFTQAVIADLLDAICREAADRLEVPAAPPQPRTKSDVAESFLARLDGTSFDAPSRVGSDLGRQLARWARPVTGVSTFKLVVQLDPPDDMGAWYVAVLAPDPDGHLEPVEAALVTASQARREEVKHQLTRLERLFPELLRPGAKRRGEVILSQDEAWSLMTSTGDTLAAAGFDVRVPALSRRKPTPSLRLTSADAEESVVGAQQLANVHWSAVFDDVELTAEEISRLAAQAKPLVKSRGQWVELDRADLAQAAAALADRADATQLTGAEMLRHALGLEGSPLAGGITITGDGWAAELLRSASDIPEQLPTKPEGFVGELRSYQAEARAWLSFLDRAGLGGCLALDMGLGKTPTLLAHLNETRGQGVALVIAPPAVVGNWAAEAERFVPDLDVHVHHGASRADLRDVPAMAANTDVVLTTYGTAVRDIESLEKIEWSTVVLDEAQAIKNPSSETAQQLRRLQARTRVALTGTPIENGLGDLWAIMDFTNPGLVGPRAPFIAQLSQSGDGSGGAEQALRALNGILVFRRTKAEPAIAAELPDRIDELDHCTMTPEQIGLYQAVLDKLIATTTSDSSEAKSNKGAVLAAITALKQVCNHPAAYQADDKPLDGRSGKLTRLDEIVDAVFANDERVLIFTHFASWGEKLAAYLTERTGVPIACYHGGLARGARDKLVQDFQAGEGAGAMVLSLKAGGTGLNLTAASHVVLYDRWWNPAVEDQARDRVWRIGQTNTVICHRLVCPGTVDERVEEVVAGKRRIADLVLPKSSSIDDLDAAQLQAALGINPDAMLAEESESVDGGDTQVGDQVDEGAAA